MSLLHKEYDNIYLNKINDLQNQGHVTPKSNFPSWKHGKTYSTMLPLSNDTKFMLVTRNANDFLLGDIWNLTIVNPSWTWADGTQSSFRYCSPGSGNSGPGWLPAQLGQHNRIPSDQQEQSESSRHPPADGSPSEARWFQAAQFHQFLAYQGEFTTDLSLSNRISELAHWYRKFIAELYIRMLYRNFIRILFCCMLR